MYLPSSVLQRDVSEHDSVPRSPAEFHCHSKRIGVSHGNGKCMDSLAWMGRGVVFSISVTNGRGQGEH